MAYVGKRHLSLYYAIPDPTRHSTGFTLLMDKALRPERFDTDPDSSDARKQWNDWYFTFQNYLTSLKTPDDEKFQVLANLKLKRLAKDCGFKAVNASEYNDETIRVAFIRDMLSNNVRQRLLKEDDIDLAKASTQARALETAESQSLSYSHPHMPYNESCALHSLVSIDPSDSGKPESNPAVTIPKCFLCGYNKHPPSKCPAREALCRNCNKVGYFQRPIATKSRRLSSSDQKFVESKVRRLLTEGIIEPSCSSWRAQILATFNVNHKKRMVVDYSRTVNRFTYLDAYPLPHIDELVEKISQYEIYTTLDLQSAYHQVPIREDEKQYTAFEACCNLHQFCRIPFDFTNGFQRLINNIITKANLKDTFVYVDNITICSQNMSEHNINYGEFLNAAKEYGLTFNEDKTSIAARTINLLGFQTSHGVIKPDPERFRALRELPPPPDLKSQQRAVGMFAYYSNWISHFPDKIHNLIHNKIFLLPDRVKQTFEDLKRELENAAVVIINYQISPVVETDASDTAIAATLNQDGQPVAFFSRTLNPSERNHSPVEKEVYAIVEALRKWRCSSVLLKKQRESKYHPAVEEVEVLDCNPKYAHVRLPNGKEKTVSVKHLAPREEPDDLGTSECLADVNDLIETIKIAHEMCSNDEAADSPTPTDCKLLKQK
ncbi:uncharacterized protein DEA37_0007583 [Paragonimus westermani]|uniref:Reverse transcriptase domain-containing protein n=1 Tax=Paragonimus westermani TaxID=34504 RepID=A0A5J4P3E0_9TREM|nr:uncharacterized protein DEA37_0007583 [Paragonimus westermani]